MLLLLLSMIDVDDPIDSVVGWRFEKWNWRIEDDAPVLFAS